MKKPVTFLANLPDSQESQSLARSPNLQRLILCKDLNQLQLGQWMTLPPLGPHHHR
jgi:hypothetical protein